MDLKHIKDLMAAMGRTGTDRLKFKTESYELELERCKAPVYQTMSEAPPPVVAPAVVEEKKDIPASHLPPVAKKEEEGEVIKSPMVGTFYSAPGPDDPPFVKPGDTVTADTVVCIVEAMKVMNEIKAGVSGVIGKMLVESGHPVEFGTPLFKINSK